MKRKIRRHERCRWGMMSEIKVQKMEWSKKRILKLVSGNKSSYEKDEP